MLRVKKHHGAVDLLNLWSGGSVELWSLWSCGSPEDHWTSLKITSSNLILLKPVHLCWALRSFFLASKWDFWSIKLVNRLDFFSLNQALPRIAFSAPIVEWFKCKRTDSHFHCTDDWTTTGPWSKCKQSSRWISALLKCWKGIIIYKRGNA